jgi:acetyltransferase
MHLAKELISRTRLYTLLSSSPGRSVNMNALALTLVKVSQMVIDLDELVELDINPLWVTADGILAISASIRIAQATCPANERLAIHPYPKELEQTLTLKDDQTLLLRPILPEDEPAFQAMLRRIPSYDVRMRFLRPLKELPRDMAAHLTQLDYDRDMAFVLAGPGVAGKAEIWGMVSMHADPDRETAEYAIVLDRTLQGQGLGYLMMQKIIEHARKSGIQELFGAVLGENKSMLRVNRALHFKVKPEPDDPELMHVSLKL